MCNLDAFTLTQRRARALEREREQAKNGNHTVPSPALVPSVTPAPHLLLLLLLPFSRLSNAFGWCAAAGAKFLTCVILQDVASRARAQAQTAQTHTECTTFTLPAGKRGNDNAMPTTTMSTTTSQQKQLVGFFGAMLM